MTDRELQVIAQAAKDGAREGALIATKRWLGRVEAAEYLNMDPRTFDREMRVLLGQTRATPGKPMFDRLEIDALLDARKVNKDD